MTHSHTKIRQGLLLALAVAALALTAVAARQLVAATASLTASGVSSIVSSSPSQPAHVRSGPEQSMPSGPSQLGPEGRALWQRFHEQNAGVSFHQWWNNGRPAALTANLSTRGQCQDMCPLRLASGSARAH